MLRAENLTKKYGSMEAVKDVSFQVPPGETLSLLGPSGSGKTTVLRLIAGFERPDKGSIFIDGMEVSSPKKMVEPSKRNLSMIFQDLALWPHMTVKENVQFAIQEKGLTKGMVEELVLEILEKVNLNGFYNRYPSELSGGEKQRLAIGRALAAKPIYLLMDEPFSNLDSILKDELQQVVTELRENADMGVLYVTHNVDEAMALGERIAIMRQGKIEQIDAKPEILSNPKNDFVRRFLKL